MPVKKSSLWAQPDSTEKGRNICIVAISDTWGFTDKTTIYRKLTWQFDVTVCSNKSLHYLGDFLVCKTDSEHRRLEGNRWVRLTLPIYFEFSLSCLQKYIFFTFSSLQATLSILRWFTYFFVSEWVPMSYDSGSEFFLLVNSGHGTGRAPSLCGVLSRNWYW